MYSRCYSINNLTYLKELCRISMRNPRYLLLTVKIFLRYIKRYMKTRFFIFNNALRRKNIKKNNIPLKLRNIIKTIPKTVIKKDAFSLLPFLTRKTSDNSYIKNIKIALATQTVPYSEEFYKLNFHDPEDTMAVHRFVWLLKLLENNYLKETINFGLVQILKWCETSFDNSDSTRFGAYNVCERLVSWLFFLIIGKEFTDIDDNISVKLKESFECQLDLIINNLEYNGKDTNNHVLNNGRALYVCGRLLGNELAAGLGREIFYLEYDKMIENGILKEGSSHYQLVLTKSFVEIFWTADVTKDKAFLEWIKPRLMKMFIVSNQLQSKFNTSSMPLFGDISPDIEPEWLIGYPFMVKYEKKSRWFNLLFENADDFLGKIGFENSKPEYINQTQNTAADFWYYLNKGNIELWITSKYGGISSHGHNDNGSLVIFYKGKPVIADAGFKSYTYDEISLAQISHLGHNVPLLDGIPSDIGRESLIEPGHLASSFRLISLKEDQIDYEVIYFNGFVKLRRTISLKENEVKIIDAPKSSISEKLNYKNRWHFLDDFQYKDCFCGKDYIYFSSGNNFCVKSSADIDTVKKYKSVISQSYGDKRETSSVYVQAGIKETEFIEFTLQFNETV